MNEAVQILLSLFTLLFVSVGAFFAARTLRIPYTVFLVIIGLVLIPLSHTELFSYIAKFELTPDLLFFVFLPILIFESAYNMNIRHVAENIRSISLLSVVSLIISAFFIGGAGYVLLNLIGFNMPFMVMLLFGALISATDPVAVLALFKEFGAPKRLALIFEGESLFNDGTSLALFLIVLEVFLKGFHGSISVFSGVFMFVTMIAGGTMFGFFMGSIFSKLLQYARHEHLQLTLTMLVAHLTFIFSELISHFLYIGGFEVKLSSIVATVVASMVIGNYGKFKMTPKVHIYMDQFWGYFAFVANSLVFLLLGLLFSKLPLDFISILTPLIVIIAVVMVGRAVSVYSVVGILNAFKKEEHISWEWQHLLAWGSLRGALAITMVLLIPDSATYFGWEHDFSVKDFIMAMTIGCVYFTLFVKATTMSRMMHTLKIDTFNDLEYMEYREGKVYVYAQTLLTLLSLLRNKTIDEEVYVTLRKKYLAFYHRAFDDFSKKTSESKLLFERAIRAYAIGIEKRSIGELYEKGSVSEIVYRRVIGKLEFQMRKIEHGTEYMPTFEEISQKDVFMQIHYMFEAIFSRKKIIKNTTFEKYLYYRALSLIARNVVDELLALSGDSETAIFSGNEIFSRIIKQYEVFESQSTAKMNALMYDHSEFIEYQTHLAERDVYKAQESALTYLLESEALASKVQTVLAKEFEENAIKRL